MPQGRVKARGDRLVDDATIRELLLTWPVRQLRGVRVPPPSPDASDSEWSWKYERRYGSPKLNDREDSLRTELGVLTGAKCDLKAVVQVRRQIKHAQFTMVLSGTTIDRQREDASGRV